MTALEAKLRSTYSTWLARNGESSPKWKRADVPSDARHSHRGAWKGNRVPQGWRVSICPAL